MVERLSLKHLPVLLLGSGEGEDQGKDETDHWLISWDWDPACGGAAAGVGGEGWPSGAIR